jgi:osomolarity two-component system response regulator SSK1
MPETLARLLRLRKPSLLRRLSAPEAEAESEKDAGVGADPASVFRQSSSHLASPGPPPQQSLDADLLKSCPLTTSSSSPADPSSSSEDIAARGATGTDLAASEKRAASQPSPPSQATADKPGEGSHYQDVERRAKPIEIRVENCSLDTRTAQNSSVLSGVCGQESSRSDNHPSESTLRPSATTTTSTTAAAPSSNPSRSTPSQAESLLQPSNLAKGHLRVLNAATSSPLQISPLETVDEGDGPSPPFTATTTASSPDKNTPSDETYPDLSPGQFPGILYPTIAARRRSILPPAQQHLVNRLLEGGLFARDSDLSVQQYQTAPLEMAQRKIWVRRPGASATLVSIAEDSVVDELRDHVLRKYSNSLGRAYDSPDLFVRISPRERSSRSLGPDRLLSPEEALFPLIDQYYPGGQSVAEALTIEAPPRKTPVKPSPRQPYFYHAEPGEQAEYFPLMPVPVNVVTPPGHPPSSNGSGVSTHQTPAMSVLTTGKVPPLPSPGSRPSRHSRRPPFNRHTTNSPVLMASTQISKGNAHISLSAYNI